jgi:hypothetical protein
VVAKVKERLAVCKQAAQKYDLKISNLRKISELEVRKQWQTKISYRFAALENVNDSDDLQENVKTSGKTL